MISLRGYQEDTGSGASDPLYPWERPDDNGGPWQCFSIIQSVHIGSSGRKQLELVYECRGNGKTYEDKKECKAKCNEGINDLDPDVFCLLPEEKGVCRARVPMWFYDHFSRSCRKFFYGGCGGNNNRFWSERECLQTCRLRHGEVQPKWDPRLTPFKKPSSSMPMG